MGKAVKWFLMVVVAVVAVVMIALVMIPHFVEVQKYRPQLEKKFEEATGRPVRLEGEIRLSLFPWVGLRFSELHVGNPPGFQEKDFLYLKTFDLRVKPLSLLRRDLQVQRFRLDNPEIILERNGDGRGNWEQFGRDVEYHAPEAVGSSGEYWGDLPIKGLVADEISITNGKLVWIDQRTGQRKEIMDIVLRLQNVSLERSCEILFSAKAEGKSLSLKGQAGPLSGEAGRRLLPLDVAVKALDQLELSLKGHIMDPLGDPRFDLNVHVPLFSPRRFMTALGNTPGLPPLAFERMTLDTRIEGGKMDITLSDGRLDLDESHAAFSARLREMTVKPDMTFILKLDKLDLDRYLPPQSGEPQPGMKDGDAAKATAGSQTPSVTASKEEGGSWFGRLRLDGSAEIGKLKVHGLQTEELQFKVSAENEILKLDPLNVKLYEGRLSGHGTLNVKRDIPESEIVLQGDGIQAGPLLRDLVKKDFLTGTMELQAAFHTTGTRAETLKQTLKGKGEIRLREGSIKGPDFFGLFRSVKPSLVLDRKDVPTSETTFSELYIPFSAGGGFIETHGTTLSSPNIKAKTTGKANLTSETLDFRIEPKFVGSIKGLGDVGGHSQIAAPVLVKGTFSSPKFIPDVEGMVRERVEGELKNLIVGGDKQQGETKSLEDKAKGLMKSLPFGR